MGDGASFSENEILWAPKINLFVYAICRTEEIHPYYMKSEEKFMYYVSTGIEIDSSELYLHQF